MVCTASKEMLGAASSWLSLVGLFAVFFAQILRRLKGAAKLFETGRIQQVECCPDGIVVVVVVVVVILAVSFSFASVVLGHCEMVDRWRGNIAFFLLLLSWWFSHHHGDFSCCIIWWPCCGGGGNSSSSRNRNSRSRSRNSSRRRTCRFDASNHLGGHTGQDDIVENTTITTTTLCRRPTRRRRHDGTGPDHDAIPQGDAR
mmetsp:Transcript_18411/g.50273  ORF Transcript_18411/g.50273 Transcript_18411/m.50273 type:complete len:201 (+) Transcript_18411:1854-2456(+)